MITKQASPYKQLKELIEQERLHILLSRDKRIELMRKLSHIELINSMEGLLYKYEALVRLKSLFEEYRVEVNNLTGEFDIFEAVDLEDAQELWKNFLKKLSLLNKNASGEKDEENLTTALKGLYDSDGGAKKKKSQLNGPINDIFYKHGLMVVYGTIASEDKYKQMIEQQARSFADTISKKVKVKIQLKKDVDITGDDIKNYHLILFGGLGHNDLVEEIADEFPISLETNLIRLGEMEFSGEDTRLMMLSVNPLNPAKYLLVYSAIGFEGIRDMYGLYHGPTDFVLGNGFNWLARGYFDKSDENCWQYSPNTTEVNKELMDLLNKNGWESLDSKHYMIHFQKNSTAQKDIKNIIKMHENNYSALIKNSGLSSDKIVNIYIYEANRQKEQITGSKSDAGFDLYSPKIHLVYNEPIVKYGAEKILQSLYRHIKWSG